MQAGEIDAATRKGYLDADYHAGLVTDEEYNAELDEIMQGEDWTQVYDGSEETAKNDQSGSEKEKLEFSFSAEDRKQ